MLNRRLLRIKVLQVLYGFFSGATGSLPSSERDLRRSVDRFYDLLHLLLLLPETLVQTAEERIERGRQKYRPTPQEMSPNRRFVENRAIAILQANEPLHDYAQKHSLGWGVYQDLVRHLMDEMEKSTLYLSYMDSSLSGWEQDRDFVAGLFEWLSDSERLHDQLEEISPFWITDLDTAFETLYERAGKLRANDKPTRQILETEPEKEHWEFAIKLLHLTVLQHEKSLNLLRPHLHNWEAERIATMDMLILEMAVVESLNFSDIPRRVTLNEYIELARLFSTPTSPAFVNGVIDSLMKQLLSEGLMKKMGRGLQGEKV